MSVAWDTLLLGGVPLPGVVPVDGRWDGEPIGGSPVVLVGDRRPLSNRAMLAAAHEAMYGRTIFLPVAELEVWRYRDPGAAR